MKSALLALPLILPATAMPPEVGTISENVVFSRATDFSGRGFQTLTDTRLSEQPANVQVLVYLTPW